MDDNLNRAVKHVFVSYYNKGLIYKGKRIVNWCPHCKSAISDIENEYVDQNTSLWSIRYPYEDGTGEIVVATTRPETMFGDTAVAVNPRDPRYKDIVGKMLFCHLLIAQFQLSLMNILKWILEQVQSKSHQLMTQMTMNLVFVIIWKSYLALAMTEF